MRDMRLPYAVSRIRAASAHCCRQGRMRQPAFLAGRYIRNSSCWLGRAPDLICSSRPAPCLGVLVVESHQVIARRALRICSGDTGTPGPTTLLRYLKEPKRHHGDVESLANHLRQAVKASKRVQAADAAGKTRISAVLQACQLAEKRFPAPITLGDLSRLCGVARRTLEYGFKQMYDTTPLTFIKSQRLTRSRMALLYSRIPAPINATAQAHGFTHMGQYSSDYRRLFGETPSMTVSRGRVVRQSKQG